MVKVENREEAWKVAREAFPSGFEKDELASQEKGYPIYRGKGLGKGNWLADLGGALELHVYDKLSIINIELEPEIKETAVWSAASIRKMCISNDWYTAGDVKAYSKMLDFVDSSEPTKLNIWKVAKDILTHTDEDDLYVEMIMFTIAKEAVNYFYEIL